MNVIITAAGALATIAPIVMQQLDANVELVPDYVVELKVNRVLDGKGEPVASPTLVVPAGQSGQVVVEAADDLLVEIHLKTGRNVEGTRHHAKFTLARTYDNRRRLLAEPELLVQTGKRGQIVIKSDSGDAFSCEILVRKPMATWIR